jgi:4-hydroxy-tetrahydrodipicolinate reductase
VNSGKNERAVVVDFSSDSGARAAAAVALSRGAALVVGTTALAKETVEMLRAASKKISVLVAPNTSLGVAALADIALRAAGALGPKYTVSIVEAHHSGKKDAPSGTAIRLANAVRAGGIEVRDDQVLSIRSGDVIGEHTIRFAGPGEYIELTHRATSRDLFAMGALKGAAWIAQKESGWWTMEDVVGLQRSAGKIE